MDDAIVPMHPTLVRMPFHRRGRAYEDKIDGWRILAYKDGARVLLVSGNGVEHPRAGSLLVLRRQDDFEQPDGQLDEVT